jgi:hypothetical protein
MHLAAQSEKAAEAHHQRTPAQWINVGSRPLLYLYQQRFVNVQLHNMYLEHVGAYVLAEGTEIVDDALHLHRTFAHTRWRYRFRLHGSESRDAKFVRFMAVAPLALLIRHGIPASSQGQTINMRHLILRG